MQYTENYSLKLPGYGDNADVGDLNDNTTAIDALIHANRQIEAPAFSTDTAYTTGDMCVYENVLYKFTADKAAGNWDSTKVTATNLADEVTDAAQSGGTTVIANPSAPATEDLNKLQVENTVYGIPDPTVTKTATGNPIEITDATDAPLVKCTTTIQGYQEGTGTPSPDNVRPIHAYTQSTISVGGRNLLKPYVYSNTYNGIAASYKSDGSIEISGTASGTFDQPWSSWASDNNVYTTLKPGTYKPFVTGNISGVRIQIVSSTNESLSTGESFTITESTSVFARIQVQRNTVIPSGTVLYMQIERGDTAHAYEPYVASTTHTATFSNSIYQGNADFVGGTARATWGYIASYNGETLPGEWISSMDEYAPGTTPTTGAQVAYELASPTEETITPTNPPIKSLFGYNHIESSTGDMEIEYITQTYQPIVDLIDSSKHVYSTAEQVVGTWIDGKPIYEKTYVNATEQAVSYQTWTDTVIAATDIDKIINLYTTRDSDGGTYVPVVTRKENGYVQIFAAVGWSYNNITIQYTKTTANRSLSKGATDSLRADLSEEKKEIEELPETEEKTVKEAQSEGEEVTEKVEEPVEEPTEKEENER